MKKRFIMMFFCLAGMSFILILIGNHIYHLGYINEAQLGYAGSIIGGFMALVGVWWTIDDLHNSKIEEREKECLPIPYLQHIKIYNNKLDLADKINMVSSSKTIKLIFKNVGNGVIINPSIINSSGLIKFDKFNSNMVPINQTVTIEGKYNFDFAEQLKFKMNASLNFIDSKPYSIDQKLEIEFFDVLGNKYRSNHCFTIEIELEKCHCYKMNSKYPIKQKL